MNNEYKFITLNEEQYRLLMCHRMIHALDLGQLYPSKAASGIAWSLEKDGSTRNIFYSLDELELYLEQLLETKYRASSYDLSHMDSTIRRRLSVINERHHSKANGQRMTFHSRINTAIL